MLRYRPWLMIIFSFAQACVSDLRRQSDSIVIESSDRLVDLAKISAAPVAKRFEFASTSSLEAFACSSSPNNERKQVILLNPPSLVWGVENACSHWLSQRWLHAGFDVLAVNRAGYGDSSGVSDLGGQLDKSSLSSLVSFVERKDRQVGCWGFSEAALSAISLAKVAKLDFLVLGEALYDAEQLLESEKNSVLKDKLAGYLKSEGELAIETRSVAWDFEFLPAHIVIYHSRNNPLIPFSQVEEFKSTLDGSQFDVELISLPTSLLNLNENAHKKAISESAQSLARKL